MKLLLKSIILFLLFSIPISANEFSFTFEWGNLKSCTSGNPNKVSNPIFELKNVPEGTIIKDAREIVSEDQIFLYKNGSPSAFSNLFRFNLRK